MHEADYDQTGYQKFQAIADIAKEFRPQISRSQEHQRFDLTDLNTVSSYGHERLVFSGKITTLSFDSTKLLLAIINGEFIEARDQTVELNYPHIRGREILGKTVFTMKLDDAQYLFVRCLDELNIPKKVAPQILRGFSSAKSICNVQEDERHQFDIAEALAAKLEGKPIDKILAAIPTRNNESEQREYATHIAEKAYDIKLQIDAIPTLQQFNLDIRENEVESVQSRLHFPGFGRLTFDCERLVQGIICADFSDSPPVEPSGDETVYVYYPHLENNTVSGKTIFKTNLSAAKMLLRIACQQIPVPMKPESIPLVVREYKRIMANAPIQQRDNFTFGLIDALK